MTDWVEAELGKLLVLNYGWSLPEKKRILGEIPVYGSNGIVGYHDKAFVNKTGIVIGRKGSGGRVHLSPTPFCPIDTTFYSTQDDTSLDIKFLYFLLLHIDLQKLVAGVGVPGLNREIAYREKVFHPENKDEQRRIAYVLSAIQTAIEQQTRMIALTRELKSALMSKLFTEGLGGEKQKETEIGLVPESWYVLPLDELLTRTQYGLSIRGQETGAYGILRMTNQVDGKITTEKMQFVDISKKQFESHKLQKGDILFNRTNSFELVGRTAIFDIDDDYVFASYLIRLNTDKKKLNPFFLNHFLNWEESQKRLKSIASRAVSQSNISATRLRTFHVPMPPLEAQKEIISNIDTVIEKIKFHQQKKQLLEELFRTLLHQLMTGQTRVNDIDLPGLL
jgi:type I restriction enzyme, S subunit